MQCHCSFIGLLLIDSFLSTNQSTKLNNENPLSYVIVMREDNVDFFFSFLRHSVGYVPQIYQATHYRQAI